MFYPAVEDRSQIKMTPAKPRADAFPFDTVTLAGKQRKAGALRNQNGKTRVLGRLKQQCPHPKLLFPRPVEPL